MELIGQWNYSSSELIFCLFVCSIVRICVLDFITSNQVATMCACVCYPVDIPINQIQTPIDWYINRIIESIHTFKPTKFAYAYLTMTMKFKPNSIYRNMSNLKRSKWMDLCLSLSLSFSFLLYLASFKICNWSETMSTYFHLIHGVCVCVPVCFISFFGWLRWFHFSFISLIWMIDEAKQNRKAENTRKHTHTHIQVDSLR